MSCKTKPKKKAPCHAVAERQRSVGGFTLIELLVVIAIIGILATLSIVALSSARAKSRDAKRISDVNSIGKALELYFNDNQRYPATTDFDNGANPLTTYLKRLPTPPNTPDGNCPMADKYTYSSTGGNTYNIDFCLGGSVSDLAAGVTIAYPGGFSQGSGGGSGQQANSCTSFTYSAWGACDGSSWSRTVTSSDPSGCTGGSPVLTGSCCNQDSDCSGNDVCVSDACTSQISYGTNSFLGYTCGTNADDVCTYNVVKIGTQYWLRENLNIGTLLCAGSTGGTCWTDSSDDNQIEKYCYDHDANNCPAYGALYRTWESLNYSNPGDICPDNWHVPTSNDWDTLSNYLSVEGNGGSGTDAGGKMKEAGTAHWLSENCGDATCNSSGFTALGGASLESSGGGDTYSNPNSLGTYAAFMKSEIGNSKHISTTDGSLVDGTEWITKSVRCVKD